MNSKRKMEKIEETMDPFELFPKEAWEMIGDEMEDSKDIVSLLQALPKLDIEVDNRKRLWLIGQILPFLYNLINKEDVKSLRLTCKQWKVKVESFLCNQPFYRAYSHELDKDNHAFWEFLSVDKSDKNVFHQGFCKLDISNEGHANQNIENRPRLLTLFPCLDTLPEHDVFLERILNFLSRFGGHLWNLEFCCVGSRSKKISQQRNKYISNMVKIMQKVSNLKSLKFYITDVEFGDAKIEKPDGKPLPIKEGDLPDLPFLETLEIPMEETELVTDEFAWMLMKRYGGQIRRLRLPMRRWKVEGFKEQFPQLTELHLTNYQDANERLPQLRTALSTISAPNLALIKLNFWILEPIQLSIEEILNWLKRFPRIKYFEIAGDMLYCGKIIIKEEGTSNPSTNLVPSLETLKIMGSYGLSYNFLRCFPSLRHLELRFLPKPIEQIETGKVYDCDIWKVLPHLRKIYLRAYDHCYKEEDPNLNYCFEREIYEKLASAGKIRPEPLLYSFRDVMLDFLKDSGSDFDDAKSYLCA